MMVWERYSCETNDLTDFFFLLVLSISKNFSSSFASSPQVRPGSIGTQSLNLTSASAVRFYSLLILISHWIGDMIAHSLLWRRLPWHRLHNGKGNDNSRKLHSQFLGQRYLFPYLVNIFKLIIQKKVMLGALLRIFLGENFGMVVPPFCRKPTPSLALGLSTQSICILYFPLLCTLFFFFFFLSFFFFFFFYNLDLCCTLTRSPLTISPFIMS